MSRPSKRFSSSRLLGLLVPFLLGVLGVVLVAVLLVAILAGMGILGG